VFRHKRSTKPSPHAGSGHRSLRRTRRRVRPLLVAIVGGSGAGKSWLAARVKAALGRKSTLISLDDFYRDRSHLSPDQRARLNYDHPSAIDWKEVERVVNRLLEGRSAWVPCYDFKTHSRETRSRLVNPKEVVLVDGLWLLWRRSLRRLFGFSVFLDCPASLRLRRRLTRDVSSRGRTRISVVRQFRHTVQPMYARFVAPQARWADVVVPQDRHNHMLKELAAFLRRAISESATLRERPYQQPHLDR
jgi:uridine kinase